MQNPNQKWNGNGKESNTNGFFFIEVYTNLDVSVTADTIKVRSLFVWR